MGGGATAGKQRQPGSQELTVRAYLPSDPAVLDWRQVHVFCAGKGYVLALTGPTGRVDWMRVPVPSRSAVRRFLKQLASRLQRRWQIVRWY